MLGKKLFLGADEAGYGPNLGPLNIACTAWLVPDTLSEQAMIERLESVFKPLPWSRSCQHVPLGDSKRLYQAGKDLRSLELPLLAMLDQLGFKPQNVAELIEMVGSGLGVPCIERPPWYARLDELPVPASPSDLEEVERLSRLAAEALRSTDIQLVTAHGMLIDEPLFNRWIEEYGSKGKLLSRGTLQLVAATLDHSDEWTSAEIYCDRQGGRKNYLPVLLETFPDRWFAEVATTPQRSSYRTLDTPSWEVHFSVGGDRFPPTALASMLAKYLRERVMTAFNEFWAQHKPRLRPTAGYPVDARRFRADIAHTAQQLGLQEAQWWRCR